MILTPKEQAKELFDLMFEEINNKGMYDDLYRAKQCALIAVNRNIEMLTHFFLTEMDGYMHEAKCTVSELIENEQEVKQEIEKL